MITISNDQLTVTISEMGAELQSIKDASGREYLWQGGPLWPRRAPILFPIVCSVENDTYYVDGKPYHLPRHGFARDTMFTVIEQDDTSVLLRLDASEETKKVYPYDFNLVVNYQLDGNNLVVLWHVRNIGKREMHFQIGGHPAFLVPGCKEGEPLKGRLRVNANGTLRSLKSYIDGSHEMTEVEVHTKDGIIDFDDEFFANDSVKLHDCQVSETELLNADGTTALRLYCDCPLTAYWSPYGKQAPFVCIEPWFGLGDPRGYQGEFKDKPLMNHLLPGAFFMGGYQLLIGNSAEE